MTSNEPIITETEHLLSQEASMSAMSIGLGLTSLRKYSYTQPGHFYSSLYLITTGIERLLKLIVICEYKLENEGHFPNNKDLRNYGHDISELFQKAIDINKRYLFSEEHKKFDEDNLYFKIIYLLSDFAKHARYYNLDFVSGKRQDTDEPLKRWNDEVNTIILSRHYKKTLKRTANIDDITGLMEGISSVFHTYEDGSLITSLSQLYQLGDLVPIKQKYSTYYTYVIINFLVNVLRDLEFQERSFPMMHEYFMIFGNDDTRYILRKKSWNPNPPFHF